MSFPVMSCGVILAGGLSCSPSGDRSRARLGDPLTLEDLEISPPEDTTQDDQLGMQPEGRPPLGYTATPAVPTPASSGGPPSGYGVSCGTSQARFLMFTSAHLQLCMSNYIWCSMIASCNDAECHDAILMPNTC